MLSIDDFYFDNPNIKLLFDSIEQQSFEKYHQTFFNKIISDFKTYKTIQLREQVKMD